MTIQESASNPASGTFSIRGLFASSPTFGPIALRMALAVVMFPHGAQKLLGWFGGYGFEGTMGFLTSLGLPSVVAGSVIVLEFFAPILLLLGLGTRFAALSLVGIMLGAIATVHAQQGFFFMNWSGNQSGEGIEYHLLVMGMGLALAFAGSGRFGLDRRIAARLGGAR